MKIKSKNLQQSPDANLFRFCLCIPCYGLLAFCLLTSPSRAESPPEQLDPTNILTWHLAKQTIEPNTPGLSETPQIVHPLPQQPVKPEEKQTQTQPAADSPPVAPVSSDTPSDQADSTGNNNPNSENDSLPTLLKRQLWQTWITTSKDNSDNKNKYQLQDIIKQIVSVELKPKQPAHQPLIIIEPVPETKPNETLSSTEPLKEPQEEEIKPKLPYGALSEQTSQMIEDLSQHPDQANNPFALGEVLFLSGRLKEAAVFYQEALNRISPDNTASVQDRAWIIFQLGNCLRKIDKKTAAELYQQLITEYPDSPWTDLTKARHKLIDWYQQDQPEKLVSNK